MHRCRYSSTASKRFINKILSRCGLRQNSKRFRKLIGVLFVSFLLHFLYNVSRFRKNDSDKSPTAKPAIDMVNDYQPFLYVSRFRKNDSHKSPTAKPAIDMVNDYQPFVDFKFVFPETTPKLVDSPDLFLAVLVNSGAKGEKYRERRRNIRKTWGNRTNCESLRAVDNTKTKNLKWLLVFVVGKAAGPTTKDDSLNAEEAERNNDMLIGDIEDNYINNIIKLYMGQFWVSTLKVRPKYVLKTDDDVYVRIPLVLEYLTNENFPSRFYGGAIGRKIPVKRRVGHKWSISRKYFDEDVYPPYHFGSFFILSTDLFPSLLKYVYTRKPFHIDDAYIGIAMRDMKVKVTHISSFQTKSYMPSRIPGFSDCQILLRAALGDSINLKLSGMLHDRFELLCDKNITLELRKCH